MPRPVETLRRASIAVVLLFSGSSLAIAQQPMMLPVDPAPLIADTGLEKKPFRIEVADDETERSRGLMYRRIMPEDYGMLFVYGSPQPLAFWMKNTVLPLDLIFLDEKGNVVGVLQGTPYSEAPISPGVSAQYVLELNAGAAAKFGIDAGDTLYHPAIGNALPN